MTRRLPALLALVAVLVTSQLAEANTVTIRDWTSGHFATNATGGGGPFEATTTGALLGAQTFVTFCLEFNEHFNYNVAYNFTLSNAAVAGGVSGGNPDPVENSTRWLYYQVVSGNYVTTLASFGINSGFGALVQRAIWYIEGERSAADAGAAAVNLATFARGAAQIAEWEALWNAGHRVWAMNLTDQQGNRIQDQLAYTRVSVPEPGSLLVLGLGFLSVGTLLRKRLI